MQRNLGRLVFLVFRLHCPHLAAHGLTISGRRTPARRMRRRIIPQFRETRAMNDASLQRLTANYELLAERMPALAERFYDRLFTVLPDARPMFKIDIALQSQHLSAALALIVRNLRMMD